MEPLQNKEFYEFGEFRLSVKERLLWRNNEPIALTLKEFEVLLVLVENAGEVVGKNDLLDAVWKDVFIEEGTLTRNISRLRKKLEAENGDGGKFIETLPKRGYRLLPEVTKSNKNALVIEEKTLTHVRVEETVTIDDAELLRRGEKEKTNFLLPNSADSPRRSFSSSPLLLFSLALIALAGIGFIVYQNYFQNRAAKVVVASRVVPFSGAKGRENTPAFSPDGKQLAYSWNGEVGDNSDIYIRLVGAGESLQLTETQTNEQYPTFAPDGSHLAFVREFKDYGEVIIVPSLGGAERKIARLFSGNYSISYSPDGQKIAVIDTENKIDGEQFAVYLINIETGERKRLTAAAEFTGETTPRFSPDGKSLAFVRIYGEGKQDLFVVPSAGGEPRQITSDGATIHSLTWSADAQRIYFVSFRASNQPSVWQVSAKGGEPEIVSTGGKSITNIAASSDGKTLAFVETIVDKDVWRAGTDKEPAKKLIASSNIEQSPQFSPDGSRIIFVSDRTIKHEIWITNADGKNLRQISNTSHGVVLPQFSHDGSRIAFYDINGETSNIFTISAEGGAIRQITSETSQNILPAWSADGKQIYFTSNRTGEMNIWKISADGGEAVQITSNGAYQAAPAPDGKTIFYTKSDLTELWRVPVGGGEEEKLPEFAAAGFAGKWTMTKEGIYFLVRDSDDNFRVKFYDFAAGKIKDAPGEYKLPPNIQGNFSANGDGSVFLYSLEDQNASQIMFAEFPSQFE